MTTKPSVWKEQEKRQGKSRMLKTDTIINGDCLEVLKSLPDESIHCCVTSPPYYALRDYGKENQIGRKAHRRNISDIWFLCFVN